MTDNPAQAVLEELLLLAIEEALILKSHKTLSNGDSGALTAYFNLIEFGKQQAEIQNIRFADKQLASFDPYSLIEHEPD